jgi:8-oxo-dGTP pyrophosphatase MutT (NUDIX family)
MSVWDVGVGTPMTIDTIRDRLRHHRPNRVEGAQFGRAAVAVVLRDERSDIEFLVIHRAHRRGDPWSGHMALPGGRQHSDDRDSLMTAVRETREEVGVDLERDGELLGPLDDLRAVGRGRLLDLVITPFVYALRASVDLSIKGDEVQSAFWIPLASLRRHDVRGTHRQQLDGYEAEFPAFVYAGHTIWGLTHRILSGFLEVLDLPGTVR